ncbi:MAG: TIGR02710 family CRISPR-associated CARF protein [Nitrospirota bacterium]
MAKAFVQSVGTGTRPDQDITQPLLWHWRKSGAGFTVWIASEQSRPYAERMARDLGLPPDAHTIRIVSDPDDVETVYRECLTLFRDLNRRGFGPDTIEVDYTSGTKAITAGLVLAAVTHRCGTISYISGQRFAGTVISGTERLVLIEPRRIWADEQLRLAGEFCRVQRFDAALQLLGDLNPAWLGDHERRLMEALTAVANGYGAWDRFDYARAAGELNKLFHADVEEARPFRPNAETPARLLGLKPDTGYSADRLADLLNNAGRRLEEGRYDDALARLYRLAEMLAQWILQKDFGIDTAAVDLSKIPDQLRSEFAATAASTREIQIGLERDYRLLKELGHRIGHKFDEAEFRGIGVLLKKRNVSLLAHGLTPISKGDVASLYQKLRGLVASEVTDFDDRCAELEFPWRRTSQPGNSPHPCPLPPGEREK